MTAQAFCSALLDPDKPVPADVAVREGADLQRRYAVYRNNVTASLVDALADGYPVVQALVGEAFFRAMGCVFVRRHPPTSPILARYGHALAEFLESFPPAESISYLPDVARIESLRQQAMDAADATPMSLGAMEALVADPMQLADRQWVLHPSLGVLRSSHPVVSIWAAHQHTNESDIANALAAVVPEQEEAALVVRSGWDILVIPVTVGEANFVLALRNSGTLAQAMAHSNEPTGSMDSMPMMASLFRLGILVDDLTMEAELL